MLTVGEGYAVYVVCTWLDGKRDETITCYETTRPTNPCDADDPYTTDDAAGNPITLKRSCFAWSTIKRNTTNGTIYSWGSLADIGTIDSYAKLKITFEDYPDDTILINDFGPQISTWYAYCNETVETDSGVWYNIYEMDTIFPIDSSTKLSYFMEYSLIDAIYDALGTTPYTVGELPDYILNIKETEFKVYPQPISKSFNIDLPKNMIKIINKYNLNFIIYDIHGKKVFNKHLLSESTHIIIDDKSLKSGIYIYKIINEKENKLLKSDKLIIQ